MEILNIRKERKTDMKDNPFTLEEFKRAVTDKEMDVFERNIILGYYDFSIPEVITTRQIVEGTETDEKKIEQIKKKIEITIKNAELSQERN